MFNSFVSSVSIPAVRIVGNISSYPDNTCTQALIDSGVLDALNTTLRVTRREVIWCYSNILSGTPSQAKAVLEHPCIELIINSVEDLDIEVRLEAAWCISNACAVMSKDEIIYLDHQFMLLEKMIAGIMVENADVVLQLLRSLGMILRTNGELASKFEELGGVEYLEDLQYHSNIQVHFKAQEIL